MQNLLWILRATKYEERQAEQPLIFVFIDEKGKETMISTWWNETVSQFPQERQANKRNKKCDNPKTRKLGPEKN